MKDKGMVSSFLITKLGVFLAIFLLLAASIDTYSSFERSKNREMNEKIASFVIDSIEEADSLPGNVHMERKVPDHCESYELKISGTAEKSQTVEVSIIESGKVKKSTLLDSRINGGNFEIEEKNPDKIIISKDNGLRLEVV